MVAPVILSLFSFSLIRTTLSRCCGFTAVGIALCMRLWADSVPTDDVRVFLWLACGVLAVLAVVDVLPGRIPSLTVQTEPGLYLDQKQEDVRARNSAIRQSLSAWLETVAPTPYLRGGDLCTLCPYLWNPNRGRHLAYERVWVAHPDGESFATDWVFPPGGYDPDRPVVVLLTGLAPTEHWTAAGGFVADAAWHLSERAGMTAVVVVARGTMDTEVKEHMFHGARTSDLREAVLLAEGAVQAAGGAAGPTPLFAAGFSMGAMILANYCGQYGADARLQGAINFSGVYDAVKNMEFEYSRKTWQVFLAYSLKTTVCRGRLVREAIKRGVDVDKVMSRRVASVVDIDVELVAKFNGYKGVHDYYADLGLAARGKWREVAVPLLAVAARDDPVTHCDALRAAEFSGGNGDLLYLITDRGGHCGWPLGMFPWTTGFDFTSEAISVFVQAVLSAPAVTRRRGGGPG